MDIVDDVACTCQQIKRRITIDKAILKLHHQITPKDLFTLYKIKLKLGN